MNADREHDGNAGIEVLLDGVLEQTDGRGLCRGGAVRRRSSYVADAGADRQRFPQLVDATHVHCAECGRRTSPRRLARHRPRFLLACPRFAVLHAHRRG